MTLLSGENLPFIESLYTQYLSDPGSVDPSWVPLFEEYFGKERNGGIQTKPSFIPSGVFNASFQGLGGHSEAEYAPEVSRTPVKAPGRTTKFAARALAMIQAYRLHGHLIANIDPLGRPRRSTPPELDPAHYGFTKEDMDAQVSCPELFGDRSVKLSEIIDRLRHLYCGSVAVEFVNIPDTDAREWLRQQIELNDYAEINGNEERRAIYQDLVRSDAFETFLHTKYVGAKRFSLSGGDALIPLMTAMYDEGGKLGVRESIIGMAHRGRLNVLHNIMGKPAQAMLSEFEKTSNPEEYLGSSDVKYHMGHSTDYQTRHGDSIHLSMTFNPSHLEFVNPVVLGRARAKQDRRKTARTDVLPVLLHGDAAFSGQGIVAESLNLSLVDGFSVAGCLHIVTNNQIGFTALPEESRSTTYATDIAKILEVPIFHVNGDDPEACVRVAKLAMRYRQKFQQDVVIDLVCYRRYGHNEGDEPRFTQPQMYEIIDKLKGIREMFGDVLIEADAGNADFVHREWDTKMGEYASVFEEIHEKPKRAPISSLDGVWNKFEGGTVDHEEPKTEVPKDELTRVGLALSRIPDDLNAHRTIQRLFKGREEMARGEKPVDWGFGEALAFGTLVASGTSVRLTGQDVVRATFSQRHAAVTDLSTGHRYWPTRELSTDGARFEVYNSVLSEAGVLGYEYGYSLDYPDALVLWEAQFGDFANGAQVIIDQFISSGEDKWKRLSGLVMLLPHGYEGQGPEHSNARPERFLQLAAEDNMFVCNLTTPAQYFHALRRQIIGRKRKPLVIMTPKSLLRHKAAVSTLDEFSDVGFQHIIGETRPNIDPKKVERVVLCSGKVYYDLIQFAEDHQLDQTAIIRVEQLYPLDTEQLRSVLKPFEHVKKINWVQEEPRNMGAWYFIFPRLVEFFDGKVLPKYVGRVESASPATGNHDAHEIEQHKLLAQAFELAE
ncbi:MAG: 2-oxoglutarate dehydrogenase E1 component [bacterium]